MFAQCHKDLVVRWCADGLCMDLGCDVEMMKGGRRDKCDAGSLERITLPCGTLMQ